MSTPALSGSNLTTSSTAALNMPPKPFVPLGAFVAYFVMYSHTDHKFIQGRQSMFPRLSRSTCTLWLQTKRSFRGKRANQEPSLSPLSKRIGRLPPRATSDNGKPYRQTGHSGVPRAQGCTPSVGFSIWCLLCRQLVCTKAATSWRKGVKSNGAPLS